LIKKLGLEFQNQRRGLAIDEFLSVAGTKNIFALGDATASKYAPTAQVASQQGYWLGSLFNRLPQIEEMKKSEGKPTEDAFRMLKPFEFEYYGTLA